MSETGGPYWELPAFTPLPWNDYALLGLYAFQLSNNCYNYGANRITGTYAQPGRATIGALPAAFTLSELYDRLIADGWEPTTESGTSPEGKMKVMIALEPYLIGTFWDYHLYRLDALGWTHKPGSSVARYTDDSGEIILNPETCNRGEYTHVYGYWFIPTTDAVLGGWANIY